MSAWRPWDPCNEPKISEKLSACPASFVGRYVPSSLPLYEIEYPRLRSARLIPNLVPPSLYGPRYAVPAPREPIAFAFRTPTVEDLFFARRLHGRCEVDSMFFYEGRKCAACIDELREHDAGDEDRSGDMAFARENAARRRDNAAAAGMSVPGIA